VRRALGCALLALWLPAAAQDVAERGARVERVDQHRPDEAIVIDLAGRPLTLGGELALELERVRAPARRRGGAARAVMFEAEAFWELSDTLVAYMQHRLVDERERELDDGVTRRRRYLERGEMWLQLRNAGGLPLTVEAGRLNFEDEQRWRWDGELDAARAYVDIGSVEASLALAEELAREHSDAHGIAPEQRRVRRVIAELTWRPRPPFALTLYGLQHRDRSPTEAQGQRVRERDADESDARLSWLGLALHGGWRGERAGRLDVRLDAARVRGRERLLEFDDESAVDGVTRRRVRGWGVDAALRWTAPFARAPRLYVARAVGSGGDDAGTDRAFRQTGLQSNEADFGGVQRFAQYGALLDPELSNLRVTSIGAGTQLGPASSLDVLLHRYTLRKPADALRESALPVELDGEHRRIGRALDVVLAIEESERVEIFAVASRLRAGPAFGALRGRRFHRLALEVAFGF
jgi:hypothetical protein